MEKAWFVVLLAVVTLGTGVLGSWYLISPRSAWWKLESGAYRHPRMNEPSEAALHMRGVCFIAVSLLMCLIGCNLGWRPPPERPTTDQQEELEQPEEPRQLPQEVSDPTEECMERRRQAYEEQYGEGWRESDRWVVDFRHCWSPQ